MIEVPKQQNPEVNRQEQADELVVFLDKIKAADTFGNEDNKREFIESLDLDRFKKLLLTINGLLREIPIKKRSFDGNGVELTGRGGGYASLMGVETQYPPRQEDKEELLKQMFDASKQMIASGKESKDIALLVGTSINAIHYFSDGNGRTSRLLYYLLNENYSGQPEQIKFIKKILGDDGNLWIDANPGEIKGEIVDYMESEMRVELQGEQVFPIVMMGGLKFEGNGIDKQSIDNFEKYIVGDSAFGQLAVAEYLKKRGTLAGMMKIMPGGPPRLLLRDHISSFKKEDYEGILNEYWISKKKSVGNMIGALAEPENFVNQEKDETIKDIYEHNLSFKQKWKQQFTNFQELNDIWEEQDIFPHSNEQISKEEMDILMEVSKKLNKFIEKDKAGRIEAAQANDLEDAFKKGYQELLEKLEQKYGKGATDMQEYRVEKEILEFNLRRQIYEPVLKISEKYLEQMTEYLDGLDIWQHEFSTRRHGSYLDENDQETLDSIYYITKSGVSLRLLKYHLAEKGLEAVVQPLFEKIIFADKNSVVSEVPEMELKVIEYQTEEFRDFMKAGEPSGDFISPIRRYEKDGKIYFINPPDGHKHKGYGINKIF